MIKKTISTILVVITILSFTGMALAAPGPQPMYVFIEMTTATLSIDAMGRADCTAIMRADSGVDSVRIRSYLQHDDNGTWVTDKSRSKTFAGANGSLNTSYYVASGYQYRLLVYYTAYSGGNNETTTGVVYYYH